MQILGLRVGGSGHIGKNFEKYFEAGAIPSALEGQTLRRETLNLVLEARRTFATPTEESATFTFLGEGGERYYLQKITLRLITTQRHPVSGNIPGLILRNQSHPSEFDNIVELFAPDISSYLRASKKEWFQLEGPFA